MKKTFEEIGKQLLTLGTASLIFGFIQPLSSGKLSLSMVFVFFILYFIFTFVGSILVYKSEDKNGNNT